MPRFKIGTIPETGLPCMIASDGDTTAVIAKFTRHVPKGVAQEIIDAANRSDGNPRQTERMMSYLYANGAPS